jgi:6-phosphogluconolactonase
MKERPINMEILADPESVAKEAAGIIAQEARLGVSARGRFVFGVSCDNSSLLMLRALADKQVVWERLHLVQVDEGIAPAGDPGRNLTQFYANLVQRSPLHVRQVHAMPVDARDLEVAAARYALALHRIAGSPPVLDLVQLTLGADGRTASLFPGDPVLDVKDRDVALTGVYQGKRRITLTYPILNRVRLILWIVTGADKAEMLTRLRQRDPSIPAGRVRGGAALILADIAAAGQLAKEHQQVG